MAGTFGGNTLTQTGKIGNDTIDPTDQYFGFGNLITLGGKSINSTQPFQNKVIPSGAPPKADYTKITGIDVKLVHGDRWQELEAYMTENVQDDFVTTIGPPPWIMPKGATDPADLEYNDPKDDLNTKNADGSPGAPITLGSSADPNLPFDQASGGAGGLPPSSDTEKTQVDPGTFIGSDGKTHHYGRYILNVRGDQLTKVGGDVSLWVAGYNNTVQIGQCKASYFSQYITNTSDSQYHNTPDSYVDMNNDYKIVYDTKYRSVYTKKDFVGGNSIGTVMGAKVEYKGIQAAAVLVNLTASLCSIGLRVIGNDTVGLKSLIHPAEAKTGPQVKASPAANAAPSVQPCPFTG